MKCSANDEHLSVVVDVTFVPAAATVGKEARFCVACVGDLDPAEGGQGEDVDVFERVGVFIAPAAVDGHLEGRIIGRGAEGRAELCSWLGDGAVGCDFEPVLGVSI